MPAARGGLPILAATLLVVAGCVGSNSTNVPVPLATDTTARDARVVVALADTGIQPYHEAFRLSPGTDTSWIRALPGLEVIPTSFAADATRPDHWNLKQNQLYWFEGTRVLGVSPDYVRELPLTDYHWVYDDDGHGTMTSSVLAQASPHAFIVMVESISYNGTFEWIRGQPWIDLVSASLASPPQPAPLEQTVDPGLYSPPWVVRDIATQGRTVVFGAGNDPLPALFNENGAPWVVTVGAAEQANHGGSVLSRIPPDVVANGTNDRLADRDNLSGYRSASGTSFSAPIVVGALAEALYQVRAGAKFDGGIRDGALVEVDGKKLTAGDLRAALNSSGAYWTQDEFEPNLPGGAGSRDFGNITAPILPTVAGTPVGPWVQMGWGWVGKEAIPRIVSAFRGTPPPANPDAAAYMAEAYALREAYWGLGGN